MTSPLLSTILIPVHNRKTVTLSCLKHLRTTGVLEWAQAVVIDDGSSDGTSEAIRRDFPETVILEGDGNLWWGGAMRLGMQWSYRKGADFVFWLNDDCLPEAGTLRRLQELAGERRTVTTAQSVAVDGLDSTGGCLTTPTGLKAVKVPAGEVRPVDMLNGNCVCFPSEVLEAIGFVDAAAFPHYFADSDYTGRAGKAGYVPLVDGNLRSRNLIFISDKQSWLLSELPVSTFWHHCLELKRPLHVPSYWRFCCRHWGWRGALPFAIPYARLAVVTAVRLVIPRPWLLKIWGKRSRIHQVNRHLQGSKASD